MPTLDKIALVTGASSGFGLLISLALARKGYLVVATMRDPDRQAELVREAERSGVRDRLDIVQLDVTDALSIKAAVSRTLSEHGRIDALVNNAGYAAGGVVEEVPMEAWRAQMETNFLGVVAMTRAVLPAMRRQGEGAIIQIGSVSGRIGLPGYGAYAASKFAIEGFSESLRHEAAPFGIRVYVVEPGAYRTAIWSKGFETIHAQPNSPYERMFNAVLALSRRTADNAPDPREVAELVARLAGQRTARRLRYPIGRGARSLLMAGKLLPWRWIEAAFRKTLEYSRHK
ncbi:SDR family oxidoreductase [Paenibacillaceae bacterium WGS1546]|uniref:SDR family oxidoreductase n=1 Tax=Cohnella sp. WGS1546 TaxID=3366810 RepID=UPI00372D2B90